MSDLNAQDALTQKQAFTLEITDDEALELFRDENLMYILTLLRSTTYMTFKELEEAFRSKGKEKSNKTIYRYLKRLEEGELVVQAGKRVWSDEKKKIRTETLYMRTAKIFFPKKGTTWEESKEKTDYSDFFKALEVLLSKRLKMKAKSENNLESVVWKLKSSLSEFGTETIKNADENSVVLISSLDWESINSLIEIVGMLALLTEEKTDWKDEILSCFE
jgi:hypothetical protein